ncbi:hypothetical protein MPER_15612, partial [Moniliophthora perniciosa FA553]
DVLPISPKKYKKIAVIGPNAKDRVISGGGSAFLKASYVVTPFDGVKAGAANELKIAYTVGCYGNQTFPADIVVY